MAMRPVVEAISFQPNGGQAQHRIPCAHVQNGITLRHFLDMYKIVHA